MTSTDSKVTRMFDLAFRDSSNDPIKRHQVQVPVSITSEIVFDMPQLAVGDMSQIVSRRHIDLAGRSKKKKGQYTGYAPIISIILFHGNG